MKRIPFQLYNEIRQFSFLIGKESIQVISKPGLPAWDELLPSTRLLAEQPLIFPTDHVLLLGCHHGALAVALARKLSHGRLYVGDRDFLALEMTSKTLALNHIDNAIILKDIDFSMIADQKMNAVFIQLPKGRKLARRWLLQVHQALLPGSSLYLAGSNKSGIQSSIKDAQDLFTKNRILAYKKGSRIAHFVKSTIELAMPSWAGEPGISPGTWTEFSLTLGDQDYIIHSLPGVFSFDHLDAGTQMLLSVVQIPPGAKVLDVGCGYGVIGMHASVHGAGWVDLVDNDLLAIASCKETFRLNQITNATIIAGDLLEPVKGIRYDLILSNPPFHAGLAVDYHIAEAIIRDTFSVLNPGGRVMIVANKFIHYEHMINEVFSNVSCLAESGKFHVLTGVKSS